MLILFVAMFSIASASLQELAGRHGFSIQKTMSRARQFMIGQLLLSKMQQCIVAFEGREERDEVPHATASTRP